MGEGVNRLQSTGGAQTVYFHLVIHDQETVTGSYLILKFFNSFIFKLYYAVTTGADEMIMVFTGYNMLIAGLAVMQQNFPSKTCLGKELESAVHCSVADTGIAQFYFKIELFHADMLMS